MKFLSSICLLSMAIFASVPEGSSDDNFCPACKDYNCCNRFKINTEGVKPAISVTASSSENFYLAATSAALFQQVEGDKKAGWSAFKASANEWIQVDFGEKTQVNGILLQGRGCRDAWVTEFKVSYSQCGQKFYEVGRFDGTNDRNTVVCRVFKKPIKARFFRINPKKWYNHVSLRFDLLGCTK